MNLPSYAVDSDTLRSEEFRRRLEESVRASGAVLFRETGVKSDDDFAEFVDAIYPNRMAYDHGSTPRTDLGKRVYTSTEYPPRQRIPLHNEMSYTGHWPSHLVFGCIQAARKGGATPLAQSDAVLTRISAKVRSRFEEAGIRYVRNFNGGVDLTWQQAFQTDSRAEVESFCRASGVDWEWGEGDRLRTWEVRPAVVRHPSDGAECWFNQAHLFHVSSLPPNLRETLLEAVGENDLPRNAYFGDGTPIEDELLEDVRAAYAEEALDVAWRPQDVVLLDNIKVAHGRTPFAGDRRVLVAMADLSEGKNP